MKRAYKASGKIGEGNAVVLLLATIAVSVIVGGIDGFISRWFSLFLLFPAIAGAIAGAAADRMVKQKHMRTPTLAFVAGFIGGLGAQATVHAVGYVSFRSDAASEIAAGAKEDGEELPMPAEAVLDQVLADKTGHGGVLGYLALQSQEGITVSHHSSNGITFTGIGYWILFAIEFLIAALCGAFVASTTASKQPYCENCRRWYDAEELLATGNGTKGAIAAVTAALERESWLEAVSALGEKSDNSASLISVRRCVQCEQNEPEIIVRRATYAKKKSQVQESWRSLVRFDEYAALKKALPASPPSA